MCPGGHSDVGGRNHYVARNLETADIQVTPVMYLGDRGRMVERRRNGLGRPRALPESDRAVRMARLLEATPTVPTAALA
jgi:hypothetical protein